MKHFASPEFWGLYRSLPQPIQDLADRSYTLLKNDPRPAGCRKLTGNKYLWRIRVGNYRIVYSIDDDKNLVDIIAVRDRKDAYK